MNERNSTLELVIDGMSCASCVNHIEKALYAINGVKKVQVNFASGRALVEKDHDIADEAIINAISNVGYHAETSSSQQDGHEHMHHADFWRFAISAVFAFPLLIQMVGVGIPGWVQALLATIVQFFGGWSMYQGTYHSLRHGSANMDTLIVMGTTAAYLFSLCVLFFGIGDHLYFDTSAIIITLVLFGRWLESRSKQRASNAIQKLLQLQPKKAKVKRNDHFVEIDVSEMQSGDIFMVRPGESVPVDGEVVEGESSVNEAMLTGESVPVQKKEGSELYAATNNQNGVLTAKATKVGAETALAGIIRLVEQAQTSKAPIQRLADTIAGVFVPVVLGISAITVIGWLIAGAGISDALINAVAVLVIACPCALGLATPTVIVVASGRGASMGVLFKEAAALERAEKIETLIMDKTGTITEGKPVVTDVYPEDDSQLLKVAYALEHNSQHPLAEAIAAYAQKKNVPLEKTSNFTSISGKGVSAKIDGQTYQLGSVRYAKEENITLPQEKIEACEIEGKTITVVWKDQDALGFLAISDQLRPHSSEAIQELNAMGLYTVMLTGDHRRTAEAIAAKAQVQEFDAEVLPEDKAAKVIKFKEKGKIVGMVGDGINDAPALASSDVAFAIGAGSDVAIEAADITLVRNDLRSVVDAIKLSQATFRKIRQNLFFAFIYNILGIPLAALGFLNPIIAAAAMAMSSVSVVSNALLLRRWSP